MQDGSAWGSSQAGGDGDDASPQGGPAGYCVGITGQHADRAQQVMDDRWRRSQPDVTVDPLDGHLFYIRAKLACALALLNGHRSSIRDEDWELAGIVMA